MKSKLNWCNRTLFCSPIYFALCTDEKIFKAEMARLEIADPPRFITAGANATAHHIPESENHKAASIVCIHPAEDGKDPIVVAGLLVHEAMHIWQRIKDDIGEDSPSAEFEAYSVQWISQQLMWEYKRQIYG